MQLKILHKKQECIGCCLCAEVAPAYWHMDDEGLAQLSVAKGEDGPFQVGEGFSEDQYALEEAQDSCPVSIIRIEKGK